MGRGKSSFFASLFGYKKQGSGGRQEEAAAAARLPPQRYNHGTRVRPSDDDDYYGQNWYADRDINRRASEYIERVHRGMQATSEQDE
ncbi:hypothetical protein BDA96_03G144900 [Sorghum bicolor]|jgi:hypothetical protein|uniref:Uncharacterized protein n=2 Tax=Sorghum bicolor TaxID=4558 RepID=A0A921RCU6_SORBI|nr:uncharacterized protein LOC8078144 [Sorghum bicolor]EES02817.1 hypothetical protein SORBI_3003G138300 [Sorghum bicolor]KAG0537393.1 hypothetical protein BDA96_03G144900 [Sorghum bicolor]|eukprot:XP_002457697.1 uncharacterized protein LOC8078144 [Sorghum bicolor]